MPRSFVVFVCSLFSFLVVETGCGTKDEQVQKSDHLRWQTDGSVEIIPFTKTESIRLSESDLGTLFGPQKKPYAGVRIAIAVIGQGPEGGISGPLYQLRPAWEQLTGAKLDIVEVPIPELLNKTITDLTMGSGQIDGIMQSAAFMGEYMSGGYLVPIDEYIGDPRFPQWDPAWHPEALRQIHTWDGKTYGVLNDSDAHVLYWRNDLLTDPSWQAAFEQETGKSMPMPIKTWDDVIAIAKFFNGKNWDDHDDEPDSGIALHLKVNAMGYFQYMSFSAAYTVLSGDGVDLVSRSYWFDPDTMTPLINQPGHVRALENLYELVQHGPKAHVAWDLGAAWDWFLRGKAIFTFSWGDVGGMAQDVDRSVVKGKVGASVLPGSYEVYDIANKKWLRLEEPNVVGNLVGASWHGVITTNAERPEVVYSLLALMATKPVNLWNVYRGWTGVDPGAEIHFTPPRGSANLQRYLNEGWNESDLNFYLNAYYDNFFAETMAPFLRINGTEEYWRALDENLSETMIGRLKPKDALDRTAILWEKITERRGRQTQHQQYRQSIQ